MPDKRQLEFFLLRYMPDAVKEEFVNIGVVMFEPGKSSGFADVRFTRNWNRVLCLDPGADIEFLQALERDLREQLQSVKDSEYLLSKLRDSFSNLLLVSPTRGALVEEPVKEFEVVSKLYLENVHRPKRRVISGRERILAGMREEFEQAGVWKLLLHGVPVAPYTRAGDPLNFDFGYRVGDSMKFFHAVTLKASVDQAMMLAARYPAIASKMAEKNKVTPYFTAVVDDSLDKKNERIQFALEMMQESRIKVAAAAEMPQIAELARQELQA